MRRKRIYIGIERVIFLALKFDFCQPFAIECHQSHLKFLSKVG